MIRKWISIVLEAVVAVCAVAGVALTAEMGSQCFLYFTIQSNLWIAATLAAFAVWQIVKMFKPSAKDIPEAMWRLKFVFTVSITLTGGVFCAVLAPTMPGAFGSAANVLTHVVVPVCAIADLFVAKHDAPDFDITVWTLVPPIYYLAFATVGFVLNWDFGNGLNYPYFFLNWTSPAGVFGFGGGGEYFMGTFWWILVMIALVSGIALAYAAILKRVRGGAAGKTAAEREETAGAENGKTAAEREETAGAENAADTQEENASEDGSNADKGRQ